MDKGGSVEVLVRRRPSATVLTGLKRRYTLFLSPERERTLVPGLSSALQVFGLLHLLIYAPTALPGIQLPEQDQYQTAIALGKALRRQGDSVAALAAFQKASAAAKSNLNDQSIAFLGESACYISLFRYREALDSSERAFTTATSARNDTQAGAAATNEAAIYHQLGDEDSASAEADRAVALLEHSPRKDYLSHALLSDADIQCALKKPQVSAKLFQRAIAVAQEAKLPAVEALADDHFGWALVYDGDFPNGRKFLEEARRIRTQNDDPSLLMTQAHLAELLYRTGEYEKALQLIDVVTNSKDTQRSNIVPYWPPQLKGRILLALGRPSEALAYFTTAVNLADRWRQDVLPAERTGNQTDANLSDAYDDYVQTAAWIAAEHPASDPALARKALTVLIASRAWSLRDQLLAARSRELRLPPRYFELLSQLQETQALVTLATNASAHQGDTAKLHRIRFELTDLENKIGIQIQTISLSTERNAHRNSLNSIQARLGREDLLLSFYLGTDRSFLWTVTTNQVKLYQLPASAAIARQVRAFKDAVRAENGPLQPGAELTQTLFGQLPAAVIAKRSWLIAADGALLDGVPFSALPSPIASKSALIAQHSIRFLPSEALLKGSPPPATHPVFVGVGDPIYNAADPRRSTGGVALVSLNQPASPKPELLSLGRLIGSDREVRAAAAATGLPMAHILVGADATASKLAQVLAEGPEILHFAVHVVSPDKTSGAGNSEQAAIALSLTGAHVPELLTREAVEALRVPGTLVVLSGCSSQQGTIFPSAGMVGLSRAWLLAGASAVLVTAWPTPDDSGFFFKIFYGHFRIAHGTVGQRAAAALQQTQTEMKAASGYRSNAAFWSAYSLISKE